MYWGEQLLSTDIDNKKIKGPKLPLFSVGVQFVCCMDNVLYYVDVNGVGVFNLKTLQHTVHDFKSEADASIAGPKLY